MISFEQRLAQSGIILPETPVPAGLYQPAMLCNGIIYTSGQLPFVNGALLNPGGRGFVTKEREQECIEAARVAALNAVAAMRSVCGSLDNIVRLLKLTVYVSSGRAFFDQHKIANGSSELLGEIFGQSGQHVRSAIGVKSLPLNASVEVDLIAETKNY